MNARGETPEVLFWLAVPAASMTGPRHHQGHCPILHAAEVPFAVLGSEESCTGSSQRANEFLFQMQAAQNIMVLNGYEVKRIDGLSALLQYLKNEYPELAAITR